MELATIQRRIKLIEDFQNEMRIAKEAIKTELENDEAYQKASAEVKEIATKKKLAKDQILKLAHNQKLLEDIRANTEEIQTLKEILAAELMEVLQEQGTEEIVGEDGQPIKFKLTVKLLPKNA